MTDPLMTAMTGFCIPARVHLSRGRHVCCCRECPVPRKLHQTATARRRDGLEETTMCSACTTAVVDGYSGDGAAAARAVRPYRPTDLLWVLERAGSVARGRASKWPRLFPTHDVAIPQRTVAELQLLAAAPQVARSVRRPGRAFLGDFFSLATLNARRHGQLGVSQICRRLPNLQAASSIGHALLRWSVPQ